MNRENPHLKTPYCSGECKAVYQVPAPHKSTHVGPVGWEPQSSSTMTCAGKVDHKLPVNQRKGHTYTNLRPSHYLTYAHSHITRAVAAMGSCFAVTGDHQHGIAIGQWTGKTGVEKTLSYSGKSFKCQLHTTQVGAVGCEPHGNSPMTCAGKADHGFGVGVPLALICLLKIVNKTVLLHKEFEMLT